MNKPICIVGGGIIGLLCARELVQAGQSVVVLDRAETGKESSWAGGGILSPLYPWRYSAAVTELARWSQGNFPGLIRDIIQNTGLDPEWVRSGLLIIGVEDGEKAEKWAEKYAISAKIVNSSEISHIQTGLSAPGQEAFWMPEIAQVRNPRLLAAIKRELSKKGVEFVEHDPVRTISHKNGKVTGVVTSIREIETDRCIIAAGAWSRDLCLGLDLDLDVKPIRGQMLLFKPVPGLLQRIVLKDNHYLIPRSDGRILVGSTLEDVGFEKGPTREAAEVLHQVALTLLPALEKSEIEAQWAGLRPGSPEGVPYVGVHPEISGFYVCTGHFRNGVVLGPASARLMADLILGREPILDPESYKLRRNSYNVNQ